MASGLPTINSRPRKGFSLAELMVVILIISFAATMAILAYSNSRKSASVRSGADKVRSIMVSARNQSIADGESTQLVFDLTNQQLWVDSLNQAGQISTPKIFPPEAIGPDVVMDTVRIGGTTSSQGLVYAVFRPEGTNPFITVNLRRDFDDATVDENYYSVQMYPSSSEPKVWPNARK